MTLQQWHGRFAIGTSNDTIDLDDNAGNTPTITVTNGNYYIAGYTSEAAASGRNAAQLVEEIQYLIRDEGGNFASVTCTYSESTGKVTFGEATGKNIDFTWTDTALRDLLGYTSAITIGSGGGSATAVAPNEAQYTWRPDRGASSHPVDLTNFWESESNSIVLRSNDGTTYTVPGNLLYRAQIEYMMLAQARAITPSTGTVNQDFQSFFDDVCHLGNPIRIYMDRTAVTSADYVTAIVGDGGGALGAFTDYASRHIGNYQSLWDFSIPLLKHVN
jgi:hypothetical protein